MATIMMHVSRGDRSHAAAPHPFNLDPMIPVLGRILTEVDFTGPLKTAVDCLDSGPLLNVSLVSLKSLPYLAYGDNSIVKEFDNGISCRMRYLEAGLMSTASLVYNFVFSVVFSALSLITLGQVKMIVDQMRKHWTHTALAAGAIGISCIGFISPKLGAQANAAGLLAVGVAVVQWLQGDVISKFSAAYQRHRMELRDTVLQGLGGDRAVFITEFVPLFDYLDTHLNDQIQTFSDLTNIAQGVREHLPNVAPTATPDLLITNLQQVLSNWRGSADHSSSGGPEAITITVSA